MKRREFITLLGGAVVAWPLATRAQQPAMPVVGVLGGGSPDPFAQRVAALRQGLKDSGIIEGQNVVIEYRWAEDQFERLPALAADLVSRRVAVIVAYPDLSVMAAKAATSTIPIVFSTGGDPVRAGLVASFNRPGGNITGVSRFNVDLIPKRLELLHELVPHASIFALITDENNADSVAQTVEVLEAARKLGLQLLVHNVRTSTDVEKAFATLVQQRAEALVLGAGAFLTSQRQQIIAAAARHTVPAIYASDEFPQDGGLVSYGNSTIESFRQVGVYAARILKGDKPGDLPVERPTKFALVINLNTAKALGMTINREFLLRADEVIE